MGKKYTQRLSSRKDYKIYYFYCKTQEFEAKPEMKSLGFVVVMTISFRSWQISIFVECASFCYVL